MTNKIILTSVLFAQLATRIAGIYLIGQYLATPFASVANYLIQTATEINALGDAWENTFDYIETKLNKITDLGNLQYYASRLIAFIANPVPTIFNTLRILYPSLSQLVDNTYAFIRPIVTSLIHETVGTLENIQDRIIAIISTIIPHYNIFRFNPVSWVIDRLREYSSLIGHFLSDPDGFLRERIKIFFPDIWAFLQDPRGFILEKLIEGLEIIGERYLPRLSKIVENFLSNLF